MIIAYLGRNVKDYRKNYLKNLARLEVLCPACGGNTALHDSYDRHVHIGEKIEWIVILRVICIGCKRTHAVLPDFIRPYKHYSACDCELALRDVENGTTIEKVESAASVPTIKRWTKEFKERGQQAAGALRALLNKFFNKTVNEVRFTGIKIFGVLEHILNELPGLESSNLAIGEANLWITNHMAGVFV